MDTKTKKYDEQEIAKRSRILTKKGKVGLTSETAVKYSQIFNNDLNSIAFGE